MSMYEPDERWLLAQKLSLECAKAIRDAILFSPVSSGVLPSIPQDALNPAQDNKNDTDAGFGFTYLGKRFYLNIVLLSEVPR